MYVLEGSGVLVLVIQHDWIYGYCGDGTCMMMDVWACVRTMSNEMRRDMDEQPRATPIPKTDRCEARGKREEGYNMSKAKDAIRTRG